MFYYVVSCKCFQYDENYVGTVLPKEVTFCNLNNNINDSFLREMCKSHGVVEDVTVYYHPKTRRHLGIGTVSAASERLSVGDRTGIEVNCISLDFRPPTFTPGSITMLCGIRYSEINLVTKSIICG